MRALTAFTRKEILDLIRSGRLAILGMIFAALGVMNPLVAKLTPLIIEMLSDSLAESGIIITDLSVSAMDSWVQFFKNIPIGLIAFVLIESSIFTKEYATGTVVMSLTKGLRRSHVVISKTLVLALLWSLCYWLSFLITYAYNAYFWDNSVAQNLMFSVFCSWLFGIWTLFTAVFFSVVSRANVGVLCGTGGAVLTSYLVSMIPKLSKYMPTELFDGSSLIYGAEHPGDYILAIAIAVMTCAMSFFVSILLFNKKQL